MSNNSNISMLAVVFGCATTLSSTNPNMQDYENFIQRCAIEASQSNPITDVIYGVGGSLGVKWFVTHTKRRDFILFSVYKTEVNTYLIAPYKFTSFGMLNNFYGTLEHEEKNWHCL